MANETTNKTKKHGPFVVVPYKSTSLQVRADGRVAVAAPKAGEEPKEYRFYAWYEMTSTDGITVDVQLHWTTGKEDAPKTKTGEVFHVNGTLPEGLVALLKEADVRARFEAQLEFARKVTPWANALATARDEIVAAKVAEFNSKKVNKGAPAGRAEATFARQTKVTDSDVVVRAKAILAERKAAAEAAAEPVAA